MKAHSRHVPAALLLVATAALLAVAATAARAQGPSLNAGPQAGTVWQRGLQTAAKHAHHTTSPNLIWHGGPVMTGTTQVHPIFWGTSWKSTDEEVTGIDALYAGLRNNTYTKTNAEYTDASGPVSTDVRDLGSVIDSSPAISHAPQTSDILAEVQRMYPTPTANAYYPVYVDQPRGHARYCAWHSSGSIGGTTVQFAFFFKLDGDPGCDPQSPSTDQSQGLAALGNVTGHELSEMLTDPQLDAWYDSQGAENADKCAWTFGPSLLQIGGESWRIQGNWSNAAYNDGYGYVDATRGTVVGCVDGTN